MSPWLLYMGPCCCCTYAVSRATTAASLTSSKYTHRQILPPPPWAWMALSPWLMWSTPWNMKRQNLESPCRHIHILHTTDLNSMEIPCSLQFKGGYGGRASRSLATMIHHPFSSKSDKRGIDRHLRSLFSNECWMVDSSLPQSLKSCQGQLLGCPL